jgi:transcriptional regulator
MSNPKHHKGGIMSTLFTSLLENDNLTKVANSNITKARNELHILMQLRDELENEVRQFPNDKCKEVRNLLWHICSQTENIEIYLNKAEKDMVYGRE